MKKIVLSLAVIAIVGIGAIGATRAYFTSTATVTGNTFTAGSMDLMIDTNAAHGTGDPYQKWEKTLDATSFNTMLVGLYPGYPTNPGYASNQERNFQVIDIKNEGNVNGKATIKFDATSWSALADNLNFVVEYKLEDTGDAGTWSPVASGLFSAWNGNTYNLGDLPAGKVGNVRISWSVPTSAGNDIQKATLGINTTFGLKQFNQ